MIGDHLIGGVKQTLLPEQEVKWSVVEFIVDKYYDRHPEETIGCLEHVKKMKSVHGPMDSFGIVDKDSERRHMYELPPNLLTALTMKYPEILKGKNLNKFLKKFPGFRVTEKV